MESDNIAALKARIERLEAVKKSMAKALFRARRHLDTLVGIEASLKHHRPSACSDMIDAALEAHYASSTLETALNTLRGSQFSNEPAHDM